MFCYPTVNCYRVGFWFSPRPGSEVNLYLWAEEAEGWLAYSDFCFYAIAQFIFSCRPEPHEQCYVFKKNFEDGGYIILLK